MGPRSLVLVTVDCLRADHVGFMGYERSTTPFLDSLAGRSLIFPNAIVGGAPTYYSFPAILASRAPLALGRDVIGLVSGEETLASALQKQGYATAAFVAGNPYLSAEFGYHQGFDIYSDFVESVAPENDGAKASPGGFRGVNRGLDKLARKAGPLSSLYDELYFQYCRCKGSPERESLSRLRRFPAADVLVDKALKWLAGVGDQPFFLWLHFMDPHAPYYPREEALALMGQRDITAANARYWNSYWNRSGVGDWRLRRYCDRVTRLYDAGIRWVDEQLRKLAAHLHGRRWEDLVFAVTSDHGEEFLDHGGRYHPPSNLSEEVIHVPLLIHVPGSPRKQVSESPFSHVHLAPTLLDFLDLQPCEGLQGRSFRQEIESGSCWPEPAIVESVASCTNPFRRDTRLGKRSLAIREERYKLVLSGEGLEDELYDLRSDPQERMPLPACVEKAVRTRLLEHAREHLERSLQTQHSPQRLCDRVRSLRLELGAARQHAAEIRMAAGA